jgi:hypothetical protein
VTKCHEEDQLHNDVAYSHPCEAFRVKTKLIEITKRRRTKKGRKKQGINT